jgi:hypothetical protein
MTLEMNIEQTDNGWILSYLGHDCLEKKSVHQSWQSVLNELDEYFGYYTFDGKLTKKPQ